MDNSNSFKQFLKDLHLLLVGNVKEHLIRVHTRNLEKLADLSFPLKTLMLKGLNVEDENLEELIVNGTKTWRFSVCRVENVNNDLRLFIQRPVVTRWVLMEIITAKENYGSNNLNLAVQFRTNFEEKEDLNQLDLSQLRAVLFKRTANSFVDFVNRSSKFGGEGSVIISICLNIDRLEKNAILCGPVLDAETNKKSTVTAADFFKKRTVDMRLMAEHKYGLRATKGTGWQEFFDKLGEASVFIELLQNNISHAIKIDLKGHCSSSSKGAQFILYNCARLASLLKSYEEKVSSGFYPVLPDIREVDFDLLKEPEEWELIYASLLQFPLVVENCIEDVFSGRIYLHSLCGTISKMCSVFSVYYRRIKVLTEPRTHVLKLLHARIYLLKAVQQVLHNSLDLLRIQPVRQM